MDRAYVSEFTRFMDDFLAGHPDVVAEQQRGWRIYWDKAVDLAALQEAEEDALPFDAYEYKPPRTSPSKPPRRQAGPASPAHRR